jgi:hypothetical protein
VSSIPRTYISRGRERGVCDDDLDFGGVQGMFFRFVVWPLALALMAGTALREWLSRSRYLPPQAKDTPHALKPANDNSRRARASAKRPGA